MMGTTVTESKLKANTQNALQSTGPKTVVGKRQSAKNATKHGLCALYEVATVFDEVEEFAPFQAAMHEHYAPVGPMECALVERLVSCSWRLRRVPHIEASIMSFYAFDRTDGKAYPQNALGRGADGSRFVNLTRYETAIERSMYRALDSLNALQSARRGTNEDGFVKIVVQYDPVDQIEGGVVRPDALPEPF